MIWQNSHLRFTDALTFIFFLPKKYLFLLIFCSSIACINPALSPGHSLLNARLHSRNTTQETYTNPSRKIFISGIDL